MNSSGPEASFARRWERVARSYLRLSPAGRFTVAVAGPDDAGRMARLVAALRHCAKDLGLGAPAEDGMASGAPATGAANENGAWVEVVDLGMVDEERLGLLALEEPLSIDLLVWSAPEEAASGLRALYLLGVFAWAKAPGKLVCLLPGGMEIRVQQAALDGLDLSIPHEFHSLRGESNLAGSELSAEDSTLLAGILQAALARADASARQRSS